MSAAVMAAGLLYLTLASGVGERVDLTPSLMGRHSERANLARPFPARHVVLMELHELDCRGHGALRNCLAIQDDEPAQGESTCALKKIAPGARCSRLAQSTYAAAGLGFQRFSAMS